MTMVHYQVYDLHHDGVHNETDGRFGRLRQSGTYQVTSGAVTPVTIGPAGVGAATIVVVRNLGSADNVYVEQRGGDDAAHSAAAAMSAHNTSDTLYKRLLKPGEDATLKMRAGGSFAAVVAAALT